MLRSGATKLYCEAPMMNAVQANHLYEVGILMRTLADEIGLEALVLVTPTTLKKFLTGHGDAPAKHTDCQKVMKSGRVRPLCVVCGAKELHNIEFEKDAGRDKLHAWGLSMYGAQVEAGKLEHTQPARRGQGKAKVAKHNAAVNRKQRKKDADRSATKQSVRKPRISKR